MQSILDKLFNFWHISDFSDFIDCTYCPVILSSVCIDCVNVSNAYETSVKIFFQVTIISALRSNVYAEGIIQIIKLL